MSALFEFIHKTVCMQDLISESCFTLLHFDGDLKTKNLIGGMASIFVKLYAAYTGIHGLVKMFQFQDPYIASVEEALSANNEIDSIKVELNEFSKPLIGFWSEDNPDEPNKKEIKNLHTYLQKQRRLKDTSMFN